MPQLWEVVGGTDTDGVLVRSGRDYKSAAIGRLSAGSTVVEAELVGVRLHYSRLSGTGPDEGWVSILLGDKKLLRKISQNGHTPKTPSSNFSKLAEASARHIAEQEEERRRKIEAERNQQKDREGVVNGRDVQPGPPGRRVEQEGVERSPLKGKEAGAKSEPSEGVLETIARNQHQIGIDASNQEVARQTQPDGDEADLLDQNRIEPETPHRAKPEPGLMHDTVRDNLANKCETPEVSEAGATTQAERNLDAPAIGTPAHEAAPPCECTFTDVDGDMVVLRRENGRVDEYVNGELAIRGVNIFHIDLETRSYRDPGGKGSFRPEEDLGVLIQQRDCVFAGLEVPLAGANDGGEPFVVSLVVPPDTRGPTALEDDLEFVTKKQCRDTMTCLSPGCGYHAHSDAAFGSYCCIACYETRGRNHGARCERRGVGETSRAVPFATEDGMVESDSLAMKHDGCPNKAQEMPRELSDEEKEAKRVLQEAQALAHKMRTATAELLESNASDDRQLAFMQAGLLLGEEAGGPNKEDLATSLQRIATAFTKDGVLDEAIKVAKKLQDKAFKLLKEDRVAEQEKKARDEARKKDALARKDSKDPKFQDSALREETSKTVAAWHREIAEKRGTGYEGEVAQKLQDAASALLKDGFAEDALWMAEEAEAEYRRMGSRWRLGCTLDILAKTHLALWKQDGATGNRRPNFGKALRVANEAVSLLIKIGHPKEEENLASARATLSEIRAEDARMQEETPTVALEDLASKQDCEAQPDDCAQEQQLATLPAEKDDIKVWRAAVAQQRCFYQQAPRGRGDLEGLAQTLLSAAAALLAEGSLEEAGQLAEEATAHFRKLHSVLRLGTALETTARANIKMFERERSSGDSKDLDVLESESFLKARRAACEAVSVLSRGRTQELQIATVAAQCTLVRVQALEQNHSASTSGITSLFRVLTGRLQTPSPVPLKLTFGYAAGLIKPIPFARFDIRTEVCLQVGGFSHGQVVQDDEGNKFMVVGVKPWKEGDNSPQLWFQPKCLSKVATCCFFGVGADALRALFDIVGTESVKELEPLDCDSAEDVNGELVTLCRECLLPLGDMKYLSKDGDGHIHGECLGRLSLEEAEQQHKARHEEDDRRKTRDRKEYDIGWKPERMIPRSEAFFRRRGICRPISAKPTSLYSLVLDASKPPRVRIVETRDPEAFVNLSYLVQALQVRIKAGMAPYFSLDTPRADEAWQVKTFGPPWIKGTCIGEVLFQADYHLKELSMGDSLFEQPVAGMKNCWDYSWKEESWRGREWFVVKDAKVLMSDNNVLVPRVRMGVEAREQIRNPNNQLIDAAVTSTGHPLVQYAEAFTHFFDLIAERKSVVHELREVSKSAILAKFLVDNKVELEDFWLQTVDEPCMCKMDIPFNKKERYRYEVLVCDGAIKEQHGGVLSTMVGLYGGVDLNIDAFDLSMPTRISKTIQTPDYAAIYTDPGHLGTREELEKLSQRELRRLIQEAGGDVLLGPAEKADLVEQLLAFRLRSKAEAQLEEAPADGQQDEGLEYLPALADDLRRQKLPEEKVGAVLSAIRTKLSAASAAASESQEFWKSIEEDSTPHAPTLRAVFKSRFSDRRQDGILFLPPPVANEEYMRSLEALAQEERAAQAERKRHFFSTDFVPSAPGSLFPTQWRPTFNLHTGRGSRVSAGGDAVCSRTFAAVDVNAADIMRSTKPFFDKRTEDGVRFRIYRRGDLEVRSVIEADDGKESVGAVFRASAAMPLAAHLPIMKATEFVWSAGAKRATPGACAQPSAFSYFVLFETDLGDELVTEQQPDGTTMWEEKPVDMEERYMQARVLRVTDCTGAGKTVADLRHHLQQPSCPGANSSREHSRKAFALVGGTPLKAPGNTVGVGRTA